MNEAKYLKGDLVWYLRKSNEDCVICYHKTNNNLILFDSDSSEDAVSVFNCTRDSMYLYLINALNINKNIIVYWSKIPGTTSDYIIFYDVNTDIIKNKSCNNDNEVSGYTLYEIDGYNQNTSGTEGKMYIEDNFEGLKKWEKKIFKYINSFKLSYSYKYTEVKNNVQYKIMEKEYNNFDSIYIEPIE
jgi:hypothetical protein